MLRFLASVSDCHQPARARKAFRGGFSSLRRRSRMIGDGLRGRVPAAAAAALISIRKTVTHIVS